MSSTVITAGEIVERLERIREQRKYIIPTRYRASSDEKSFSIDVDSYRRNRKPLKYGNK